MGFWSTLGKIGGALGAGVGGLFTGGATWAALPSILGGVGQVVGGAAQGAAQGRAQEGLLTQQQNQLDLQRWIAQQNAQQEAARLGLTAPTTQARQAFLGNLLSNDQSNGLSPIPNPRATAMSFGGMNPADFSATVRQSGDILQEGALRGLQRGAPYTPTPMPQMTQMPQAGFWEKLGGGLGTGLSIAGAFPGGAAKQNTSGAEAGMLSGAKDYFNQQRPAPYNPFPTAPSDPYNLMPPYSPFFPQTRR